MKTIGNTNLLPLCTILGGRRVTSYLLFAYFLLTLAYPGVNLVTDVLMA